MAADSSTIGVLGGDDEVIFAKVGWRKGEGGMMRKAALTGDRLKADDRFRFVPWVMLGAGLLDDGAEGVGERRLNGLANAAFFLIGDG